MNSLEKNRCPWPGTDAPMIAYHDTEWGVPVHDDVKLFEFLVLDAFQAGLTWKTILHKREHFRKAFDHYDVVKISRYSEKKYEALMQDAGIIRNQLKIRATIQNAKSFIAIQKEFGSFDRYIWSFTQHKTIVNHWKTLAEIPAKTAVSDAMSKDLIKRGFKFVGSTICYAFMQAAGMVNDHLVDCPRHKQCK
jgi:DNA-3-methyladenine glycosylase I